MKSYAWWLFGIAGLFNIAVGSALLFARPGVIEMFGLDMIGGSNLVFANLTGMFVILFGYAYLHVAADPVTYRPYIHLGAAGKLLAVLCVVVPWWIDAVPGTVPALVSADFVFAMLFLAYLRRTSCPRD